MLRSTQGLPPIWVPCPCHDFHVGMCQHCPVPSVCGAFLSTASSSVLS